MAINLLTLEIHGVLLNGMGLGVITVSSGPKI